MILTAMPGLAWLRRVCAEAELIALVVSVVADLTQYNETAPQQHNKEQRPSTRHGVSYAEN